MIKRAIISENGLTLEDILRKETTDGPRYRRGHMCDLLLKNNIDLKDQAELSDADHRRKAMAAIRVAVRKRGVLYLTGFYTVQAKDIGL